MDKTWKITLLLIAAIALLPAWIVGAAALGAVLGVVVLDIFRELPRKRREKPTPKTQLPENVIPFNRNNKEQASWPSKSKTPSKP